MWSSLSSCSSMALSWLGWTPLLWASDSGDVGLASGQPRSTSFFLLSLLSGPPILLLGQVAYLVSSYRFFYIEANRTTDVSMLSTFGIWCTRPALSIDLFLLITVDNHPARLLLCVTSGVHAEALLSTIRAVTTWGRAFKFTMFDLVIPIAV